MVNERRRGEKLLRFAKGEGKVNQDVDNVPLQEEKGKARVSKTTQKKGEGGKGGVRIS